LLDTPRLPNFREFAPMDASLEHLLKRTVLVVEDNEWNRRLLEVRLEIHGYAALTATRGETALDIARQQEPDLILMDIQLPDISGIEAIRRLKGDQRTKAIPIIAVSAFALPSEKADILASGCEAYIAKPFRGEALIKLIERYAG
jgi:two-component system cell cycle response regulator DivK